MTGVDEDFLGWVAKSEREWLRCSNGAGSALEIVSARSRGRGWGPFGGTAKVKYRLALHRLSGGKQPQGNCPIRKVWQPRRPGFDTP